MQNMEHTKNRKTVLNVGMKYLKITCTLIISIIIKYIQLLKLLFSGHIDLTIRRKAGYQKNNV